MSASAVHFRGIDQVIEAYEANGVADWALFAGKNIFGQYTEGSIDEGAALLREWCDRLKMGGSTMVYQLRMYKDPKGDITNNTPFNFSFQFRLVNDMEYAVNSSGGALNTIMQRLDRIEANQQGNNEREEEAEEIGGVQGMIGRMLQKPEVQQFLMQHILPHVGSFVARIFNPGRPAAMAGVSPNEQTMDGQVDMTQVYAALPEDQRLQLDAALAILLTKDPRAGERLYKIATILQNDPGKYNMLAGML